MRKQFFFLLLTCVSLLFASAQTPMRDSLLRAKDSILSAKETALRAQFHADSLQVEKEFADKAKWKNIEAREQFPALKGDQYSGIIPVSNVTETPDPNIDYKILFEVTTNNPDSTAKNINSSLDEVARVINLHVASGIPAKRILPVIVVHAAALNALKTNDAYQKKYKTDNPNLQLIADLRKMGATFIACGQAMEFFEVKKEDLLPDVKVSLTAQTVLTHYQLKGYVWHPVQ